MSKKTPQKPNKSASQDNKNLPTTQKTTTKEKYRNFLQWYVMPVKERKQSNAPVDLSEYVKKTNTTKEDIMKFQDRSDFVDEVTKEALAWGKSKSREILQWAYQIVAEKKTMENMEKFFDLINKVETKYKEDNPANGLKAQNVNFFNVNERQYDQIIKRESRVIEGSGEEEAA